MKNLKVTYIDHDSIAFDNGIVLTSDHNESCCEIHYLSFEHLTLEDFEGLLFDLSSDDFFERIDGYGIALKPINNFPIRIPGYGYNNGYYSDNLTLVLSNNQTIIKSFDITDCQTITG